MENPCRDFGSMAIRHLEIATKLLVCSGVWNDFSDQEKQRCIDDMRQAHHDEDIVDVLVLLELAEKNADMHDFIISAIYP